MGYQCGTCLAKWLARIWASRRPFVAVIGQMWLPKVRLMLGKIVGQKQRRVSETSPKGPDTLGTLRGCFENPSRTLRQPQLCVWGGVVGDFAALTGLPLGVRRVFLSPFQGCAYVTRQSAVNATPLPQHPGQQSTSEERRNTRRHDVCPRDLG